MNKEKLVLVLTGHEDPMWPFLLEKSTETERQRLRLFPTDLPKVANLTILPDKTDAVFTTEEKTWTAREVLSVWWRRIIPPNLRAFKDELRIYCENEYRMFFAGLEAVLPNVLWVSRPSNIAYSENKAIQITLAKQLGLQVPERTVLTNNPSELLRRAYEERSIYKSIYSPLIPISKARHCTVFTTVLTDDNLVHAEGVRSCPAIVQTFLPKKADIRVTVFEDVVFAVQIKSQEGTSSKIDFRAGARHLPHLAHELPKPIADACVKLTTTLGLKYGAIDLALLHDDSYVFLEINPNGQWGWLEEKTGQPMRRAFLDMLFQHTTR